jgi:hypothetical protein
MPIILLLLLLLHSSSFFFKNRLKFTCDMMATMLRMDTCCGILEMRGSETTTTNPSFPKHNISKVQRSASSHETDSDDSDDSGDEL